LDGDGAVFSTICHCGDGPKSIVIVSDQFLSNGGSLTRSETKVMAESVFEGAAGCEFCSFGAFSAHLQWHRLNEGTPILVFLRQPSKFYRVKFAVQWHFWLVFGGLKFPPLFGDTAFGIELYRLL